MTNDAVIYGFIPTLLSYRFSPRNVATVEPSFGDAVVFDCIPTILHRRLVAFARLSDLIDSVSGCVQKPNGFPDRFGDSCWRSSWTYASLLILYGLKPSDYQEFHDQEGLSIDQARTFVQFYAANCATDDGLTVFNSDQSYTRDQLLPLMYLLACLEAFDPAGPATAAANSIVKNLREHESHHRPLSGASAGSIERNVGYLINRLCHQYGINYEFFSRPAWQAAAVAISAANIISNVEIAAENVLRVSLGQDPLPLLETDNDKIATERYELFLKQSFAASLSYNAATARFEGAPALATIDIPGNQNLDLGLDDLVAGFSVFNALASLGQLRVSSGHVTNDLSSWRGKMENMSNLGWGPAFDIVSDRDTSAGVVDSMSWRITTDDDNDCIQSQRPGNFMSAKFPARRSDGVKTLDALILRALSVLWS